MHPDLSYSEALADANLMSLCERREHLCITLFSKIIESDGQHKLARLLPARNDTRYSPRNKRMFSLPDIKTKVSKFFYNAVFKYATNVNSTILLYKESLVYFTHFITILGISD